MKYFTAKTLDEAISLAAASLKVSIEELKYEVVEEKRGLFRKTATISVYELADAIEFAQNYMYEYYENCIVEMPWELSYSIDYNCVFNKFFFPVSYC